MVRDKRRWEQVQALEDEGRTLREIASLLGLDTRAVRNYSEAAGAQRARLQPRSMRRKVEAMAEVYPNSLRRRWIYRQFGMDYDAS